MNAVAAFENRRESLREQLEAAQDMTQAVSAATMVLEQIACDLAQDEQDDFARQRQQAVMALAKRMPDCPSRCACGGKARPRRKQRAAAGQGEKVQARRVGRGRIDFGGAGCLRSH